MKFIHITDTHLVAPGQKLYELDPLERLGQCIESINRLHSDAEFAIVTGDLAHAGNELAYRALRVAFGTLRLKTHFILGNHDSRQHFFAEFPESPRDAGGFVQYTLDTSIGRFICRIPTNPPCIGEFYAIPPRVALRGARARRDMPVYLFMHHPPFAVGLKRMDEISLQQPEKFAAIVSGHKNIRHLFFGHLHRPIGGSWHGIPFTTMRATSHQVALDFRHGRCCARQPRATRLCSRAGGRGPHGRALPRLSRPDQHIHPLMKRDGSLVSRKSARR
ncbi:MAG: phosphodiesterase [Betaproteobacteria bacterium]|nr:phosphodiesterase [Betaproteobacteria bacterium]